MCKVAQMKSVISKRSNISVNMAIDEARQTLHNGKVQ